MGYWSGPNSVYCLLLEQLDLRSRGHPDGNVLIHVYFYYEVRHPVLGRNSRRARPTNTQIVNGLQLVHCLIRQLHRIRLRAESDGLGRSIPNIVNNSS